MSTNTVSTAFSLDTSAPTPSAWRVEHEVDQRLVTGPYVLIDRNNMSPQRVSTRAQADAAMHAGTATAVAGQLRPCVLAADVDPVDTGADAEAGEAVADDLVLWADGHGLPWLVRASGRPGGRHVLVAAAAESIAASLSGPWQQLCSRLGRQHGAATSPRQTLRLLSSPHRLGLDTPVLGGTLRATDLPEPVVETGPANGADVRPRRRPREGGKRSGVDRSAREYGQALARLRAGWSTAHAWAAANVAESKAREMGERDWRRWIWAPATTVVAGEKGLSEDEAWTQFEQASPPRARSLGRDGWRSRYWQPALVDARQERPRRLHTHDRANSDQDDQNQHEVMILRRGLAEAAEHELDVCRRRPQFRRSVRAALDALAPVVVSRAGSLSQRAWCESARIARETLRTVLSWLQERGVLARSRSYQDGVNDSSAWQPGTTADPHIAHARKTWATRGVHPTPHAHGHADTARMSWRHARERREFRLRKELSARTESSKQTYKTSSHPTARALRSLWFQKQWWRRKSQEEQEQRRVERRRKLGVLHRSTRSHWLTWLEHRSSLVLTAARLDAGHGTPDDEQRLSQAPRLLHRGLTDPQWFDWHKNRSARTQASKPVQPALA